MQNNRLRVFVNHYATYCQKFQYPEKPTNSSLRSFANDLRKISQNLIAVVSQHSDIPNNVKDAALDYALLVRDLSKVVEVAPYLPENKDEAVLKGFFYGLNGDFSGGINEIKVWHQKFLAADQKRRDGYDKYILTLVKHGIQIQTED